MCSLSLGILLSILCTVKNRALSYSDSNYNLTFRQVTAYSPFDLPGAVASPNFFRQMTLTNDAFYLLDGDSMIAVYSRADPSLSVKNISDYRYSSQYSHLTHLTFNLNNTLVALTRTAWNITRHQIHQVNTNGSWTFKNLTNLYISSTGPSVVTIQSPFLFAYYKKSTGDVMHICNFEAGTAVNVSLSVSNFRIAVTPDRTKAIVWSPANSQFYVHQLDSSFTQIHHQNNALTASSNSPWNISFSADSQLALIEYDEIHPILVFNLSSLTAHSTIPTSNYIYTATFLDSNNRFILVQMDPNDQVYDLWRGVYCQLSSFWLQTRLIIDYDRKVLYALDWEQAFAFEMTLTYTANSTGNLSSNSTANTTSNDTANTTTNSTTNTTTNSTSATNTTNQTSATPNATTTSNESTPDSTNTTPTPIVQTFYTPISYTQLQMATLFYFNNAVETLDTIIDNSFTFVFSSPLALFFLSTFNYFNLSSLYILLNIRVPIDIFNYFAPLFESLQSNALNNISILSDWKSISHERVDDLRALYFDVSSDLFSKCYLDTIIILGNIIVVEVLAFLLSKRVFNLQKFHKLLSANKIGIYWGIVLSNMVNFILAWRFSINGGGKNISDLINLAAEYIILIVLASLVVFSLLVEIIDAKREGKQHYFKIALRNWWNGYENFIYPLLVINDNPYYFLTIIGLSQLLYLYNSFTVPTFKVLAILKALYPIIFHCCFVIFLLVKDEAVLSYTTIACLGIFLMGSFHYLIEVVVRVVRAAYRALAAMCNNGKNKISNISDSLNGKMKSHETNNQQVVIDKSMNQKKPEAVIRAPAFKTVQLNKQQTTDDLSLTKKKDKKDMTAKSIINSKVKTVNSIKKEPLSYQEDMHNFVGQQLKDGKATLNLTSTIEYSHLRMRKIKKTRLPKELVKMVKF